MTRPDPQPNNTCTPPPAVACPPACRARASRSCGRCCRCPSTPSARGRPPWPSPLPSTGACEYACAGWWPGVRVGDLVVGWGGPFRAWRCHAGGSPHTKRRCRPATRPHRPPPSLPFPDVLFVFAPLQVGQGAGRLCGPVAAAARAWARALGAGVGERGAHRAGRGARQGAFLASPLLRCPGVRVLVKVVVVKVMEGEGE